VTEEIEPLVPADVDLRGLEYMPLFGNHLFGSDFNSHCSDAEWRAGVTLWWAAWNQVPAASLPNEDIALARLADLGRDVKAWRRVKERALRGFVLCLDGRLYHRFLALQAIVAWEKRVKEREKKRRWRDGLRDRDAMHAEPGPRPGQNGDKPVDGTADVTGRDVTGRDGIKTLTPLSSEAPDNALGGRQTAKAQAKREAKEAARRAIAYLNEKAGTRFQAVEANLKLPIARMLQDGAVEADLLAVVDLKIREAARGEFDKKYLRPATLWNGEKFAQYIGQVQIAAAPAAPIVVKAFAERHDGELELVIEYPANGVQPDEAARNVLAAHGPRFDAFKAKNIVLDNGRNVARFSIEELRRAH
jgi:uncharacterized phage protein (TIGR02220 family)